MDSTVGEVMTTRVVSVTEEADYKKIVATMVEYGVGALPVIARDGRVIGVVSEGDLLYKEEFKEDDAYRPPVRSRLRDRLRGTGLQASPPAAKAAGRRAADLMTRPAVTIRTGASVVEAARLIERCGIRHLPVVDDSGCLKGMISRRNLLLVFLHDDDDITETVQAELAVAMRSIRIEHPAAAVHDGVVTLSGTVERRSEAQKLVRRVSGVEGVVSVPVGPDWRTDDVVPAYVQWNSGA
ncbi:CBS domain-containing protein [Nocardiopsis ansamitocini]|uniref:CBS domain-containing protein n=1 Tax=Nocardiopsis ansamitocini TaxID=1670832 RepID=A0A9W6P9A5_9ACTN|nr:CBS domain-containing protein [Nocardiopsis ansamitocini]GLU49530.1 hypothetical protein Nans01_38810 [Nocardiopsis ansamitocini]